MTKEEAYSRCNHWACGDPDPIPWQTPDEAIESYLDDYHGNPNDNDFPTTIELKGYLPTDESEECDPGDDEYRVEEVYSEDVDTMAWIRKNAPHWLEAKS